MTGNNSPGRILTLPSWGAAFRPLQCDYDTDARLVRRLINDEAVVNAALPPGFQSGAVCGCAQLPGTAACAIRNYLREWRTILAPILIGFPMFPKVDRPRVTIGLWVPSGFENERKGKRMKQKSRHGRAIIAALGFIPNRGE